MGSIIGLVGQVCAGKSAVADAFRRRGAWIWDADKMVHQLYEDPRTVKAVVRRFGSQVLDSKGRVDRRALGQIVFADATKLRMLTEQVIFPRTGKALQAEVKKFRRSNAPALILDAPTLFEAGRESLCDHIVYVRAPLARRLKWARARGWTRAELLRRERRMSPAERKRRRADSIIENHGTLADLDQRVGEILARLGATAATRTRARGEQPRNSSRVAARRVHLCAGARGTKQE